MILLLILSNFAFAGNHPTWMDHFNSEDEANKYYVGRAVNAPSEVDAVFLATTSARKQAIAENYGVYVNFENRSFRANDTSSTQNNSSQTAQELSGQVRLQGFEQKDIVLERGERGFNAWIYFKYPKKEVLLEKGRLDSIKGSRVDAPFNTFGKSGDAKSSGELEIHSDPEGLPVQIDSYTEILGKSLKTPMLLSGIEAGKHIIMIDDARYQLHQEEVQVVPGGRSVKEITMRRASGALSIKTNLEGATVSIGTHTYKSPISSVEVLAGVPVLIQITHPEAARPFEAEVILSRNEELSKTFMIESKPALVSLSSFPDGAIIYVDGLRQKQMTPATIEVSSRDTHKITLSKPGYEDQEFELGEIQGGGTKIIGMKRLQIAKVELPPREEKKAEIVETKEEEVDDSKKWSILLGVGGAGSPVSNLQGSSQFHCCGVVDIGIERNIFNILILRAAYDVKFSTNNSTSSVGQGTPKTSNKLVTSSVTNEMYFGSYIKFSKHFYAGPEVGRAKTSLDFETDSYSSTGYGTKSGNSTDAVYQNFVGGRVGFKAPIKENIDLYLESALRKYKNAAPYEGGQKFQMSIGVMVGF